jgi:diguanylate cyclase
MRMIGSVRDEIKELKALAEALGTVLASTQRMVDDNSQAFQGFSREIGALVARPRNGDGADILASALAEIAARIERKADSLSDQLRATSERVSALETQVEEWRVQALTDQLTRLPNRRAATARLEEALNRSIEANGRIGAVALVDIDRFKAINDTHGHAVGDAVLRFIAVTLRTALREEDLVARWGGEEFLVVFQDTDLAKAQAICERLRKDIEGRTFTLRDTGKTLGKITISVGLTPLRPSDTIERILERADQALYAAKNGGRNTLRVAYPEAAPMRPARFESSSASTVNSGRP